jgi:hypothetical protein
MCRITAGNLAALVAAATGLLTSVLLTSGRRDLVLIVEIYRILILSMATTLARQEVKDALLRRQRQVRRTDLVVSGDVGTIVVVALLTVPRAAIFCEIGVQASIYDDIGS